LKETVKEGCKTKMQDIKMFQEKSFAQAILVQICFHQWRSCHRNCKEPFCLFIAL